ncbi:hypothetical protein MAR_023196 [Mya arenaria]|uniref:Mitochondria-eating protein C-terminal domain-containing protein n=1 Tax=Mya arenaria TaxID=6604 RepID=A0ABY7DNX8_MYAAR|nr:hypothetical protein MAR_023196 [Mya arenaria]
MGTSLSAQRNGSTFYTSEQTQEELLSELEEKFIEWQEKIKAFKGKIKSSESIRKYLLGEIKTASEYLRTKVPDECSAHEDSIANKLPETKRLENEITFLKAENEHLRLRSSTSSEVMLLQSRWQPKRISFVDSQTSTDDTLKKVDPVHVDKQMKQLRKEVADSIVPVVQKAYMDASWQDEYLSALKPFINKCLFIGWMMVVQTPPMNFKYASKGDHFDTNIFKQFTKSGKLIDFVVWPALVLHKDGPVVGKGIAQPEIKTAYQTIA